MKNKHLVMLLLSSCCLAACVDSKYDLSDVNTDDAVMGESWVAPLGMGYVTSDDVVNVEKVPSIREVDGAYVMIYDGEMKIKGKSLRHPSPEYTNCIKSSNNLPVPNILPDNPSLEIIEASSTINKVFVARLSFIEKLLVSLENDCCRYIFL